MSGVKAGATPAAGIPLAVLAGPAFLLVAGAAAAVGLGVMGIAAAGRGAAYLGEKAYDTVDEKMEKMANEEIRKYKQQQHEHMAKVQKYKQEVLEELERVGTAPPSFGEDDFSPSFDYVSILTAQKILTDAIERRKKHESENTLKSIVSDDLIKLRDAVAKKITEANKKKHETQEAYQKKIQNDKSKQGEKVRSLRNEIHQKCSRLNRIFSDKAGEFTNKATRTTVEGELKRLSSNIDKLLKDIVSHREHLEPLVKFYDVWVEFELREFLSADQKKGFEEAFRIIRDKAIDGQVESLEKLEKKKSHLFKLALQNFNKHKFKAECEDIKKAMANVGYQTIKISVDQDYMVFEGSKKDGKKAIYQRLKPEADQTLSSFRSQIIDEYYDTEEDWDQAGRELLTEFANYGIEFDYVETSTHFKGQIIFEKVKKQLMDALPEVKNGNLNLTIIQEQNQVEFRHGDRTVPIPFTKDMNISEIVEKVNEFINSSSKTSSAPQKIKAKERIRE